MALADLHQADIDAAVDDMVRRPMPAPAVPKSFSTWKFFSAAPRGVGAGANESAGFMADVIGAFGQVAGATDAKSGGMFSMPTEQEQQQQEQARQKMLKEGIDYTSEAGQDFRATAREWMPDPLTAHAAEQTVFGLTRFGTKAIGYTAMAGGLPGALLVGSDEAMTSASELKAQGVDLETRTKVGAITGAASAAAVLMPVAGKTVAQTVGLIAAAGPASFMAQQQATRWILQNANYDQLSMQYDPFDPVGLAVSTLVPAGFGAWAMRGSRVRPHAEPVKPEAAEPAARIAEPSPAEAAPAMAEPRPEPAREPAREPINEPAAPQPTPEQVDAARVQLLTEQIESARLTPAEDLGAAAAHSDAVAKAMDQMARGERVEVADVAPVPRVPAIETPEFKAWFGDSKVVDEQGKPLVVYHGTASDIAVFDPGKTKAADVVFTTPDAGGASIYAETKGDGSPNVMPLYVSMKNPAIIKAADYSFDSLNAALSRSGVDGALVVDDAGAIKIAAPMSPEQIKSAIGNTGRFDPTSGSLSDSPFTNWADQIRAAVDEMRAAAEKEAQARASQQPTQEAAPAAREQAPAAEGGNGAAGETPAPAEPGAGTADVQAAGVKPEAAEAQAAAARLGEIQQQFPDLQVQLDGMDKPMRLSEFLESVRREADEMRADAPDFEVAANCFLLNGG